MDDDLERDFLRGCVRYRESLQRELPGAPAADAESDAPVR